MLRVFKYRVIWTPQKSKEEDPYKVKANLVGYKVLVVNPHEQTYKTGFYSLYNDKIEIIGTQLLLNKELIIDMHNYEREEWLFANDVAMAGYTKYYNQKTLACDCILMQS